MIISAVRLRLLPMSAMILGQRLLTVNSPNLGGRDTWVTCASPVSGGNDDESVVVYVCIIEKYEIKSVANTATPEFEK